MKLTDMLFYSLRAWLVKAELSETSATRCLRGDADVLGSGAGACWRVVRPALFSVRTEARSLTEHLIRMERRLMATLAELNASLDDIKAGLAAHADKLAEIGMDLDDLISKLTTGSTDQAAIDDAVAKATEIKDSIQAESDQLDSLRSKHETTPPEPPAV
jgi:hypothetical protein